MVRLRSPQVASSLVPLCERGFAPRNDIQSAKDLQCLCEEVVRPRRTADEAISLRGLGFFNEPQRLTYTEGGSPGGPPSRNTREQRSKEKGDPPNGIALLMDSATDHGHLDCQVFSSSARPNCASAIFIILQMTAFSGKKPAAFSRVVRAESQSSG